MIGDVYVQYNCDYKQKYCFEMHQDNIRQNSSKNHLDSCYYAMLLLKLFSVQVHSCEIQINLRSVVTDFSMAIVFRLPTLSKRDPTQVFSCEYC